jgi:hypothetical protein
MAAAFARAGYADTGRHRLDLVWVVRRGGSALPAARSARHGDDAKPGVRGHQRAVRDAHLWRARSLGLVGVSLRPLAAAIGSSPRVLLYLFGSKDGLVQALLARARADELALLARISNDAGLPDTVRQLWSWGPRPNIGRC